MSDWVSENLCVSESVCVKLKNYMSDQSNFWYKYQELARMCTGFSSDPRSKVKVTSEVKVIPKIKKCGKFDETRDV